MKSLDGLRARPSRPPVTAPTRAIEPRAWNEYRDSSARPATAAKPKPISILSRIDKKQLATIVVTFILTFVVSIATSQGLAQYEHPQPAAVSQTDSSPRSADLAVTNQPDVMDFQNNVLNAPDQITLPEEKLTLPDPLAKRKEFLQQYLTAKHSELADHVDELSEQTQWKLIIGIARAESQFCQKHEVNNCWGIGGAWNLKKYKNLDEAIADVNRILEQHYIQAGLNSPGKIVNKWVGHPNANWEAAVQQELDALQDVP